MRWAPGIIPAGLAFAATVSALLWWKTGAASVNLRLPGADRPPGLLATPAIDLVGQVIAGPGKDSPHPSEPGQWSQFRGSGTGRSSETGLLKDPAQARILWKMDVGEGYAGPVLRGGRVYLLDYADGADALRCISADTGTEIWRHIYKIDIKRNHGMSRTIPAVDDAVAITLGPRCQVVAVSALDGHYLWGKDLVREYGTKIPPWYAGQCPLLRDGRVYLAPVGDKVLLTAVDARTGAVLWEVPNDQQWNMTHSSVVEIMLDGRPMLVYCASGGAVGVDESTGRVMWESGDWKIPIANVPSPVDLGDGRILFTGGYGAGAMIGRVDKSADSYVLRVEKRFGPDIMGSEMQTPVLLADGSGVLAVIPSGEMVFMDKTGNIGWHSGGAHRFGSGAYLVADGTAYVISDTGTLSAMAASSSGFQLLGSKTIFPYGRECWAPMALADGRLYVRDLTRLVCLELRAK